MDEHVEELRALLALVPEMVAGFGVAPNARGGGPLLFTGVVASAGVARLAERVARDFGPPYKPAGRRALWLNLFDGFVRAVGGVGADQSLWRRDVAPTLTLWVAFWPWASDPSKTSVRLGLLVADAAARARMEAALAASFRG